MGEVHWSQLLEGQSNKDASAGFLQLTPPTHIKVHCWQCLAMGDITGISQMWNPISRCVSLQCLSSGEEMSTLPGNIGHFPPPADI